MIRKASGVATLLLGIAIAGCNGSTDYAKPSVMFDGGAGSGGSGGGGAGAGGADAGMRPTPTPGTGSKLLVGGKATLVGVGPDSCTSQAPPSGDRWCGVAVPSRLVGQAIEDLLVVNVTKAAAGTAIDCTTSPSDTCIRLTSDPYLGPQQQVDVHSFTGDTLIYYEASTLNAFAWRPGFTGGRPLISTQAVGCAGHPTTDAVVCLSNEATDAAGNDTADLVAGPIPASGSLLPKVDTILRFLGSDDPNAPPRFSVQLSPAGDTVVWSARPTATGMETLNSQRLGDATTKRVVATNVSQPAISRDGTRYFWLSAFNYSPSAPAGTLQQAAFPAGTGVTDLATTVAEYGEAGDHGLIFTNGITAGRGTLRAIADRDAPSPVTLDTGVGARLAVTTTGNRVAYYKSVNTTAVSIPLFDVFVAGTDLTTPCHATTAATAFDIFFSNGGQTLGTISAVLQAGQFTGTLSGAYTNLGDCTSRPFGQSSLLAATAAGADGLVYGDQAPSDFSDVTLQYAQATGGVLGPGTVIQTRADATFAVLPTLGVVVYTVNAVTDQDGLYVSATLPFTTAP